MRHTKPNVVYFSNDKEVVLVRERREKSIQEIEKSWSGEECFCELCWRQTEFATLRPRRFIQKRNGAIEEVKEHCPDESTALIAERVLEMFKCALAGDYAEMSKLRNSLDISIEEFDESSARYVAPRIMMMIGIGQFTKLREKYRDVCSLPYGQISAEDIERLPALKCDLLALIEDAIVNGMQNEYDLEERPAIRPSKRFCSYHNQYRSEDAKRLYKRDHAKREQYENLLADLRSKYLREKLKVFRRNDPEGIMALRKSAYLQLHPSPLPAKESRRARPQGKSIVEIRKLQSQGIKNLSEIARTLGLTRAAVSIAIKRKRESSTVE
jgi:AraC-like DNA-binding protein